MIFKGIEFKRNDRIVVREHNKNPYVQFAYRSSGRLIPLAGHSLTNMAYAEDGRVLLALNGVVYTAPKKTQR